jgi:Tol biopolymer transport system component
VANADGSAIRVISGTPEDPTSMAWSPDSAKLAVVGGTRLSIAVPDIAPTLVTEAVPLTETATIEFPQWRPNGHELIFYGSDVNPSFNNGIYLVQADGSGIRAIVGPTYSNLANPALSPDGTEVAYSSLETDQIHVVNVETGVDRRVAFDGAGAEGRPRWSPDGTKLVFERSGVDGFQLMIGSVNGGPVTAIGPTRPDKTGGAEVGFSPDGTKILAFYNADKTSWVLEPSGGPGTRLTYDAATPPSWQGQAR